MVCIKCGYVDKNEVKVFDNYLCKFCASYAPSEKTEFQNYISEKVDWKAIDTFRKFAKIVGKKQKTGMSKTAQLGNPISRAPLGYEIIDGNLFPNEDAAKVHSLFRTFLNRDYSLNSMAKNFSLSINGLKKILTNRTYIGEIKFDGRIFKGNHKPIISPEIFYAVQRKIKTYLKPRKNNSHT